MGRFVWSKSERLECLRLTRAAIDGEQVLRVRRWAQLLYML